MPAHPIHEPVLAWYAVHARDLPWRRPDCSAWGVFVSEVMAQQTPIARVLPAWTAWMQRWPTPAALAADSPGEAIRHWDRLGYPRRALRLHAAAIAIVERHRGEVPCDEAELLALPGVGAYTAAAVAAFAFGRRTSVVDTNVRRVLARAVTGVAFPAPALTAAESLLARSVVPDDAATASVWAVASMEVGALVCTARSPRCGDCPLLEVCAWQRAGAPAHDGPPRRGQAYAGTDRFVRGLVLAALRAAPGALAHQRLVDAVPDGTLRDPGQRERCLDSLVEDGLVDVVDDGLYALPGYAAGVR